MKSLFAYPRPTKSRTLPMFCLMFVGFVGFNVLSASDLEAVQVVNGSSSRNSAPSTNPNEPSAVEAKVIKTDQQWRQQLSDIEYDVTRRKGTEIAYSGKYWDHKEVGVYTCKCCGKPLFDSKAKFKSGTGWPSFYEPLTATSIKNIVDRTAGMIRTESVCSRCDAHLGHVFDDGPLPTGLRYCMNSASLNFKKTVAKKKVAKQPTQSN